MKSLVSACSGALLLLLSFPGHTFAQVNATLGGTVSDANGGVIPKVEVTAKNVNTGIVTVRTTNETGNFEFPSLQPGQYTLTAALSGFQTATYNNVQLGQGQPVRLNFTLQVGAAAQSVEVVAQADTLLATTSASVGGVLAEKEVLSLPVATRNVLDLVTLTPGVILVPGPFGPVTSFAGTQTSDVNTTRDGMVTNDGRYNNGTYSATFTSPDMVEEVRVSTNSIDPALGRGSAQVQMRTRAGSNEFHGALFYTNNNSMFNTLGYFQNLTGSQKDYLNRNQFGGRLGGPIKKNKAFFFVLLDDQRYVEKVTTVSTVLTAPARQGIFRYLTSGSPGGGTRRNGNAFSTTPSVDLNGNILTSSNGTPLFLNSFNVFTDVKDPNRTRIDPTWFGPQYLGKYMPLPNDYTVGDGLNTAGFRWQRRDAGIDGATGQSPNPNRNHITTRFDYQLNDSNKLNFVMTREHDYGVTGQTGLPDFPTGYFGDVQRYPDFYTASWSRVISSSMLNEFRFGLKRDTWQGTSPLDLGCCWNGAQETDLATTAQAARASFPQVGGQFLYTQTGASLGSGLAGLGLYAGMNVSSPRQTISPFTQIADTFSFSKGSHSFTAGFEADYTSSRSQNSGGAQTTRPFVTLGVGAVPVPNVNSTNFPGLNSSDITTAQDLLANLAGSVASIQEQFYVNSPTQTDWTAYTKSILFGRNNHSNSWAGFFKDNWKVSRNFTVNLGLRYDFFGVPYESNGLGGRFTGGQAGLFGISGTGFANTGTPYTNNGKLTTTEFVGKDSANPGTTIYNNDWNNFAPSVGISWNLPWFKRDTILRAGYGINYAGNIDFLTLNTNIGNLPGQTLNVTYVPSSYLDLANVNSSLIPVSTGGAVPFSPVPLTNRSATITGYSDGIRTPYIQSFNVSIQREIVRNLTVDVSYIGNKGSKLLTNQQINDTNIVSNGFLDAFNVTRNGGNAPLFDTMLKGLNIPGVGIVNGTTLTGSQALRKLATTNQFIANGSVGALANFLNTTPTATGVNGGILTNGNLPQQFFVRNPQFGSVALVGNNGNSTYNSVQGHVSQRFSKGVSGQFSYTFSKALGDNLIRDQNNLSLSKGLLNIDRTHLLQGNITWDLPFGSMGKFLGNSAIGRQVVGGWELSSGFSWVSGTPLTLTSTDNTLNFRGTNTADLVGAFPDNAGQVVKGNGFVQYFPGLTTKVAPVPSFGGDPTLPGRFTNQVVVDGSGNIIFANPQPGTTGNTAVNLPFMKGPGQLGLNGALNKQFRISEGKSFSVRADVINLLNKPQWGNPNTSINTTTFGRITTATGTRTITFNARFDF
ncbi:MAG TPA: carboxypeptidase-like regulatory domain-containing protein [Bryobacteraceae bacterium]|nr:carboxypeptidase-like regulatory domain-containing protein [Bryobacteraceae bacterium]